MRGRVSALGPSPRRCGPTASTLGARLFIHIHVDTCGGCEFRGIRSRIPSVNSMATPAGVAPLNSSNSHSVHGLGLVKSISSQTDIRPSFPPATSHRFLASLSELLNSSSSSSSPAASLSPTEAGVALVRDPAPPSPLWFWEGPDTGGAVRAKVMAWIPFLW